MASFSAGALEEHEKGNVPVVGAGDGGLRPRLRRDRAEHFAHLFKDDGTVTIIGFGSLVAKKSALRSFKVENFRLGSIYGYRRYFNRSDWICISREAANVATGECASLTIGKHRNEEGVDTAVKIALMDIDCVEGLTAFLRRESAYDIIEVPFVDVNGLSGVALACGECVNDSEICELWGEDCWYMQRCRGRIFYHPDPDSSEEIPLNPLDFNGKAIGSFPLTKGEVCTNSVIDLPTYSWIYPSPGYARLVYQAYEWAGVLDF